MKNDVTMNLKIKKSIQLTTAPFEDLLKNGQSIDFRLDEPQWMDLKIGDVIEFWEDLSGWDMNPTTETRRMLVTIIDIFRVRAFADIMNNPQNDIFFADSNKESTLLSLRQWWSKEREQETGVLGLKVKLIPS